VIHKSPRSIVASSCNRGALPLFLSLVLVLSLPMSPAYGQRFSERTAARAATQEVTNHTFGFAIKVPRSWSILSLGRDAQLKVTFVRFRQTPPPAQLGVEVLGVMRIGTPERIAQAFACGLARTAPKVRVTRRSVTYAKTRGVMLTGMPGLERTVQVILVHAGIVYDVVAYGATPTSEQKAAMSSLRWVAINGNSPVLRAPSRVKPCA
jgi:hypothetical protein